LRTFGDAFSEKDGTETSQTRVVDFGNSRQVSKIDEGFGGKGEQFHEAGQIIPNGDTRLRDACICKQLGNAGLVLDAVELDQVGLFACAKLQQRRQVNIGLSKTRSGFRIKPQNLLAAKFLKGDGQLLCLTDQFCGSL